MGSLIKQLAEVSNKIDKRDLEKEIAQLKAERDELLRVLKVVETAIAHDRSYQQTHKVLLDIIKNQTHA